MTRAQVDRYRDRLRDLARRLSGTAAGLEEAARRALGGEAGGSLSNAPFHLGDLGSEMYAQELSATLLGNEEYLRGEVAAALDRIERGAFGRCEECGTEVPGDRLDALPYARHCVGCASALQAGQRVNLNDGRPTSGADTMNPHDDGSEPVRFAGAGRGDVYAAGVAGGGTAIGGLGGTTIGGGDPADAGLAAATGSGAFDADPDDIPGGPR